MLLRQKLSAMLMHLLASSLLVGSILAIVLFAWYPPPYFQALDAWNVVKLLIGIDLILGPILTFIVFRPKKPTLVMDLSVIAAVQLAALFYGAGVVYQERPSFMVFSGNRFEIFARRDVDLGQLTDPQLAEKPLRGPRLLVAPMPDDPAARAQLIGDMLAGKQASLHFEPMFWKPFDEGRELAIAEAQPLARLAAIDGDAARRVARATKRHAGGEQALGYIAMTGRGRHLAVLVDLGTGRPVDIVDVDPRRARSPAPAHGGQRVAAP
jgi:hypothetical protein